MKRHPAETTQEMILRVSTELFANGGQTGVSMRQIATAADVTLPTIYHHFSNKDVLYRAVEQHLYSSHADQLLAAIRASGTPEERLEQFMQELLNALISNPLYFQIMQRGLIEDDEENHKFLVTEVLQSVVDELKKLLDEIKPGLGQTVAPLYIFGSILGFLALQPVSKHLKRHSFSRLAKPKQLQALIKTIIGALETIDVPTTRSGKSPPRRRKVKA